MPKTERNYTKNINVRVSREQFRNWEKYAKENGFDDISKLVRYATDGLVEGSFGKKKDVNEFEPLEKEIEELKRNNRELLKTQNEILKKLAKEKGDPIDFDKISYQKQLIINLLQEMPRDEFEIQKIIPDMDEIEILAIFNTLLESSIIEQYNDKYRVIQDSRF